ncbi:hypothetical protein DRQ33_00880 [bacterium]|nr:MAG: hypothetical protein DRQ33_00880 [bacterium]
MHKLIFYLGLNYDEQLYDYADITTISISRGQSFSVYYAYSMAEHWSIGGKTGAFSNTYNNVKLGIYLSPAIEFNVFPYEEYNTKSLTCYYSFNAKHNDYYEETIYFKNSEYLFENRLTLNFRTTQQWGNMYMYLSGSHYLHDILMNRLSIGVGFSLNLIEGLSLNGHGNYSFIHNQISLPRSGATEEEVYLRIRELKTTYRFNSYFGISYTFGSIYTNIVNPRL